ncbi:MAG: PEGA domain-containing protein [Myxococcota bacterium]
MTTGRFNVLGPLGGGGSQAFLGTFTDTGGAVRPVVMVFIPDEVADKKELLDQIVAETQLAVHIDHVNVLAVVGLLKLDEGVARVVEFADAENVRTVFKRAQQLQVRLPVGVASNMVAGACMGAHYAHELGVTMTGGPLIHGAIRPETLLVSFNGATKVTGYGAATLAEWLMRSRGFEKSIRDPYTAPEQSFGGRAAATVHTDVYALGAVYYEAITGRPPFGNDTGLADAMIADELNKRVAMGLPQAVADITLRALQRKSRDRFESPLHMRQAIIESGAMASQPDVKEFMEVLFPQDFPARVGRQQLLSGAVAAPGRAGSGDYAELVGPPREFTTSPPPPASAARLEPVPAPPPAAAPPPSAPAPTTSAPRLAPVVQPAPATSSPRLAPVEAPVPTTSTTRATPVAEPAPAPAPPAPEAPVRTATPAASSPAAPRRRPTRELAVPSDDTDLAPRVVYKTSPVVYVALGLAAGLGVALAAVILTRPAAAPMAAAPTENAAAPTEKPTPEPSRPAAASPTPSAPEEKAAAAPEAPKPSQLSITASPAGEIYVDGKLVGRSPITTTVKAGQHKVRLKAKGEGVDIQRTVKVNAGATKEVSLEAGKGTLIVDAPAGTQLYIDGKLVGTLPVQPLSLYEGSHLAVVKKGKAEFKQNFVMKPDFEATLHVEFRKAGE